MDFKYLQRKHPFASYLANTEFPNMELWEWFSNLSMNLNDEWREGFVKTGCWAPPPEFLIHSVWAGPRIWISHKFPDEAEAAALGTAVQ